MLGSSFSISIDQIVIFGLGFFLCALLTVVVVSYVHARAVRLTEKRLALSHPVTMKDIQSEKDRMRAEFAMSARKLEIGIDDLKTKASVHLADLAKKSTIIARLKVALEEREATIGKLEADNDALAGRVKSLSEDLQVAHADAGLKTEEILQVERVLMHNRHQLADLRLAYEEREHVIERQANEIASLKDRAEAIRKTAAEYAAQLREHDAHHRGDLVRVSAPPLGAAEKVSHSIESGANGSPSRSLASHRT